MTLVLGLTGGIATGKSTADHFFRQKKIPVIDADEIAHDLLKVDQPGYLAIKKYFGDAYFKQDGNLDRAKLGQLVFNNHHELEKLNSLTHPLISKEVERQIKNEKQKKIPLIVLDIPLLFESNAQRYCDRILVISSSEEVELKRLKKRNHLTTEEALARINSQMPLKEKEAQANYVVDNTGTINELEEKLNQVLVTIKSEV